MLTAAALCFVVAISDGDTLKARCGEPGAYQQVTVRLGEIDAPEKRQPFGQRSRAHLASLCFGAMATIKPQKKDRYGRTVARVECGGRDASAEQVRAGFAWFYEAYAKDERILELERRARDARAGLWADSTPVPPWKWRAVVREKRAR